MLISPFIIKNFPITAQAIDIWCKRKKENCCKWITHFCSVNVFDKFHVWDIILLVNKNNTLLHLRAQGKTGNFAEDLCIPENGLSLGKTTSAKRYPDFLMERIFYWIESPEFLFSRVFLLNWIMFWIESWVKQYWIDYWRNQFLTKLKYRWALITYNIWLDH